MPRSILKLNIDIERMSLDDDEFLVGHGTDKDLLFVITIIIIAKL